MGTDSLLGNWVECLIDKEFGDMMQNPRSSDWSPISESSKEVVLNHTQNHLAEELVLFDILWLVRTVPPCF